jgi:nucleotide-binding universal stress UspA family protein
MDGCILCGIDDTEHGLTVARVAARLSRALELYVVLVHVAPPPRSMLMPGPGALPSTVAAEPVPPAEFGTESQAEADPARVLLERTAEVELLLEAELRPELGDPPERILAVAEELDAELIVVGTRRRGSLATMVLGSVSHAIVSRAACPVVLVPDGIEVPAPWVRDALSLPRDPAR